MNNGRENRNNGNQEKGKEEKEALRSQFKAKTGDAECVPQVFCAERFLVDLLRVDLLRRSFSRETVRRARMNQPAGATVEESDEGFGARFSRAGHKERKAQKLQW